MTPLLQHDLRAVGETPDTPLPADRIAPRLRQILDARAGSDADDAQPRALSRQGLDTLRAFLAIVVPHGIAGLDIAARIDSDLADGLGNGWRPEVLPQDTEAYASAIETLDAVSGAGGFTALDAASQAALVRRLQDGTLGAAAGAPLGDAQMAVWFEEALSDAVRIYAGHPAAMGSIGYEGAANGAGDGAAFEGWSVAAIGDPS